MKRIFIYTFLAVSTVGEIACQRKEAQMDEGRNNATFLATAEEAAAKAKSDLLAVLRAAPNVNLGLNAAALEASQPARPIKQYQITFDKLLAAEAQTSASLRDQ